MKGMWSKNKMHGKGEIVWADSRKYVGVIIIDLTRNIEMIGSMVMGYLHGQMVENILEDGKMANNVESDYII